MFLVQAKYLFLTYTLCLVVIILTLESRYKIWNLKNSVLVTQIFKYVFIYKQSKLKWIVGPYVKSEPKSEVSEEGRLAMKPFS